MIRLDLLFPQWYIKNMSSTSLSVIRVASMARHFRDALVPGFQREYVWTLPDRLEFVRSVMTGVPFGTITTWRPHSEPHRYLIDGQQRVTTTLRTLDPEETDPEFRFGIDVRTGDVVHGLDLADPTWVPLADLADYGRLFNRMSESDWSDSTRRSVAASADCVMGLTAAVEELSGDVDFVVRVFDRRARGGVRFEPNQLRTGGTTSLTDAIASHRAGRTGGGNR